MTSATTFPLVFPPSITMSRRFSVLALLFRSERAIALRHAVSGCADVTFCDHPTTLYKLAAQLNPDLVIIELHDDRGEPVTPVIAALRAAFPLMPIVASDTVSYRAMHDLIPAAHAGLTDVIVLGADDACRKLAGVVASTPLGSAVRRTVENVEVWVPRLVRPMFRFCLESVDAHVLVTDMARALGVSPKTLAVRCAHAGAPTPRRLIGWGKLLVAADLIEQRALSVEKIAHVLALESGAAPRNLLRRYTGLRPGDVRVQGGFARLVDAFKQELGNSAHDAGPLPSGGAPASTTPQRASRDAGSASRDGTKSSTEPSTEERAS